MEDIFQLTGVGATIVPGLPPETFGSAGKQHCCSVEICCPDGSSFIAEANFHVPFYQPMSARKSAQQRGFYLCVLNGVQKSDVPIGSTISEIIEGN
ncbi:hypothetical protein EON80_28155 [bacterium]|nr:MAG: hypothetical protein EON80_28155 [bacterium]